MTHTPTPWTISDKSSNPNNGTGWRDLLAKSDYDGSDMYIGEALEKDAKFIIRACNAHEELVGLLEQARYYLRTDYSVPCTDLINRIDGFLACAKKGE